MSRAEERQDTLERDERIRAKRASPHPERNEPRSDRPSRPGFQEEPVAYQRHEQQGAQKVPHQSGERCR